MNAKEFFDTVASMRENQRRYSQTRSHIFLTESKKLEKIVDEEISRVNGTISKSIIEQNLPSLFDEHE